MAKEYTKQKISNNRNRFYTLGKLEEEENKNMKRTIVHSIEKEKRIGEIAK